MDREEVLFMKLQSQVESLSQELSALRDAEARSHRLANQVLALEQRLKEMQWSVEEQQMTIKSQSSFIEQQQIELDIMMQNLEEKKSFALKLEHKIWQKDVIIANLNKMSNSSVSTSNHELKTSLKHGDGVHAICEAMDYNEKSISCSGSVAVDTGTEVSSGSQTMLSTWLAIQSMKVGQKTNHCF
jgi:hypothetical protein